MFIWRKPLFHLQGLKPRSFPFFIKKQPKVGFRFFHKRVLNPDLKTPMEFVVTRIAKGIIYYRPVNGGGSQNCKIEDFDRYASSQKID